MPRMDRNDRSREILNEDGASDIPLHRLPGFGIGLHRQRVAFVKAGEAASDKPAVPAPLGGGSVADIYLGIVMGDKKTDEAGDAETTASTVCDVCRLPTSAASNHGACLVHQVALGHSKPPSSIDRSRLGLAIMSAQGWDPDSGRGLGRDQQGMPYPIAAKKRLERQALGDARKEDTKAAKKAADRRPKTRKETRRIEDETRRRHNRLHEQIMGHRDLDKYLRPSD